MLISIMEYGEIFDEMKRFRVLDYFRVLDCFRVLDFSMF